MVILTLVTIFVDSQSIQVAVTTITIRIKSNVKLVTDYLILENYNFIKSYKQ